jgi:Na+-transporting methylmalonyl-CoA/oxaloacetate decarboxylase gamma subunit
LETDWAQAWEIGGLGFGLVFAVLMVLALAMWITGKVIARFSKGDVEEEGRGE